MNQFDIRYKRCGPISFTCDDPDKKIHFKFDRFHTEINYDYFFIGYPETSKTYTLGRVFFLFHKMLMIEIFAKTREKRVLDYEYGSTTYWSFEDTFEISWSTSNIGIELNGYQQTDIWVNAESIPDFDIYFLRRALKMSLRFPWN